MMKPNDLDKYVSRLNEIMENSPPKISTSENLEVSPELKARIKKISLENSKVKKKGRIIVFKKKAAIKLAAACIRHAVALSQPHALGSAHQRGRQNCFGLSSQA